MRFTILVRSIAITSSIRKNLPFSHHILLTKLEGTRNPGERTTVNSNEKATSTSATNSAARIPGNSGPFASKVTRALASGRSRVKKSGSQVSALAAQHLKKNSSNGKDDTCTVIRPQHVLFVADLASNGSCLSILPDLYTFEFFFSSSLYLIPPFADPAASFLYLAALQIHCEGQVYSALSEEGRKNCFPLCRRANVCAAPFDRRVKVAPHGRTRRARAFTRARSVQRAPLQRFFTRYLDDSR